MWVFAHHNCFLNILSSFNFFSYVKIRVYIRTINVKVRIVIMVTLNKCALIIP